MGQKLVGPQTLADGNTGEGRIARTGEAVVSQHHARFYEASKRGNIFSGVTAITGVAPGTAAGTTAAFALYNPAGSGCDLVVLAGSIVYVSGTIGVGSVNWYYHTQTSGSVAITGTAIAVQRSNGTPGVGKGLPLTTATVVAGVLTRPFCSLAPWLATSVLGPYSVIDPVEGQIIVAPGYGVSLQGTAGAGTAPLVAFGCTWEEVPV